MSHTGLVMADKAPEPPPGRLIWLKGLNCTGPAVRFPGPPHTYPCHPRSTIASIECSTSALTWIPGGSLIRISRPAVPALNFRVVGSSKGNSSNAFCACAPLGIGSRPLIMRMPILGSG